MSAVVPNGSVLSLTRELPRYQSNRTCQALKIAHLLATPSGIELHFEDQRFAPHLMDAVWVDAHKVESGGYLVVSEIGYPTFAAAATFEDCYSIMPGEAP